MTGMMRVARKATLSLGLALLSAVSTGCDEAIQPLPQLATDQIQRLPAFLVDLGRQTLAAWLL